METPRQIPGDHIELSPEEKEIKKVKEFRDKLVMPEYPIIKILFAYRLSRQAHAQQERESGEPYFEHLRRTALILMDECDIHDPDIIIAALLHDAIEDTTIFGGIENKTYTAWKETAQIHLNDIFHGFKGVTEMIITLTKPRVDKKEIETQEEADRLYKQHLTASPCKTILVKMADRLDNLRTLSGKPLDKQRAIITETRDFYFPLFERAKEKYPEKAEYMLDEMKKAITAWEENNQLQTP